MTNNSKRIILFLTLIAFAQNSFAKKHRPHFSKSKRKAKEAVQQLEKANNEISNIGIAIAPQCADPKKVSIDLMDEDFENNLINGHNKKGQFIRLGSKPKDPKSLRIAIHGINGSPKDISPLVKTAIKKSGEVFVYNYSDQYRRLFKIVDDLSSDITQKIKTQEYESLIIDAHSMGARISVYLVNQLQKKGLLNKVKVKLNLIAPVINGFKGANSAKIAPWPTTRIKGVRPGKDMGTKSKFQKELEEIKFGPNIQVTTFLGGQDHLIKTDDPRLNKILMNIRSEKIIFPTADHESVIHDASLIIDKKS